MDILAFEVEMWLRNSSKLRKHANYFLIEN